MRPSVDPSPPSAAASRGSAWPADLDLIRHETLGDPALGTALSRVVLERTAAGLAPGTVRLQRTGPVVTFGRRDSLAPGFRDAVAAARERGFRCTLRLAGGRAAVFHEGTLAFSIALPDPDPRSRTRARFDLWSGIVRDALSGLGVDARIGEVAGEYCPGSDSVNARGQVKLAGVGQRLIEGGAHVGGVIVAEDSERLRDVLVPVYDALGLEWRPETAGAVEDELAMIGLREVEAALLAELESRFRLTERAVGDDLIEASAASAERHEADVELTGEKRTNGGDAR